MIIVFAATVFLIGATLGLRFKVFILIVPIIIGLVAIVGVGIASGNGVGFILFVAFLGLTALQMGYVAGAVIGCFALKPRAPENPSGIVAAEPRLYRRPGG